MKKQSPRRIDDQLRQAIEASGLTRYELWKKSGVSQASLSRFLHGERDLRLGPAAALCEVLGLELRER